MFLINEVVILIGMKDYWNFIMFYDEIIDDFLDKFFYNLELGLYMDDDLFGGVVFVFSVFCIQCNFLQVFDFGNGNDGLFLFKGLDVVVGIVLDDVVFGIFLLFGFGKLWFVDFWFIFYIGVLNVIFYQLVIGKEGNFFVVGKLFIYNFLLNGGDMLCLNMVVLVID